ncbi:MAG: PD-(D/E)XK nuclease family protein [Bdellovibrionales bacterium]
MLKRHDLKKPQDKLKWLESFQPKTQTWLVSDLKSKLEIQSRLLDSHGAIEDVAVLRASELWRRLMWQHHPEQRLVSMDLVRTLVQRELRQKNIAWAKGNGAAHTLTQLMPQFLPLFGQLPDLELVREWLRANPDSLLKWGHWFELAAVVWDVLQQEKMLPAAWAPAYLLSAGAKLSWPREILTDLSAQLTPMEEVLLEQLSQNTEVVLLRPAPIWHSDSPRIEDLRVGGTLRVAHFSSPLAEIKDAVAQVRLWLDAGADPRAIAIAAPEIETYWPLLAPALEQEGIPVDKARTVLLHSLPAVQMWLAQLRLKMGRVDGADLELATFHAREVPISYERFKRLFTNLYSEDQLSHEEWLKNQFAKTLDPEQIVTRDEFTARISRWWQGGDINLLERLVKQLLEDGPPRVRLSVALWFDWLEAWASKIEIMIHPPVEGVHAVNLMAAEWLPLKFLYLLGLSEENLRDFNAQGLSNLETQKIFQDLGVLLPSSERSTLEFEARWLLERPLQEGVMSCAVTDPSGAPLTPSRLWLLQNEDPKLALARITTPLPTRWDEVQNASAVAIASLRQWPMDHMQEMLDGLAEDLGLKPLPSFGAGTMRKLSASALEKYSECPFVYAAERLFQLSDLPAADLDLDPMTRGSIVHKVFERLTVEPRRFDWAESEIGQIVDEARVQAEIPDFGLWPQLRRRFIEQAQKFLKAELEWMNQHPGTKTVARELPFKAAWSIEKRQVVAGQQTSPGDLTFSGRIDRVDSDGQEYVVLDYKSSLVGTHSATNWAEKDSFQLALYSEVVENGFSELPARPVRGAFYYSAKDFERQKGLQVNGENSLLPAKGRRNSGVSEEQKREIFNQVRQRIAEILQKANQGLFQPQPKKPTQCFDCQWRNLCRAPHLH